jgi:hypothetical protein
MKRKKNVQKIFPVFVQKKNKEKKCPEKKIYISDVFGVKVESAAVQVIHP